MKRLAIITLALVLMFSFTACGRLNRVSENTDVPKSESSGNNPEVEVPGSENPVDSPESVDSKSLVGLWHSMNMVAAGFGERYAFNEDGTFIYGTNQMDEFERQLFSTGRWSIAEGKLKLEVNARLVVPVGDIKDIVPNDDLIILDRGVVKKIFNPPEIETYSIAKTDADPETGRNTITIDGDTFYDFNNQIDLFDEYYELINSAGRASLDGGSDPGDTNELQWWGEYKNDNLGFSIEIKEYTGTEFWVEICLLRDGHAVLEGKATISSEDEHLALFNDFGFYLYEDFSAIDIVASEDSEWAHMRGQYIRVK